MISRFVLWEQDDNFVSMTICPNRSSQLHEIISTTTPFNRNKHKITLDNHASTFSDSFGLLNLTTCNSAGTNANDIPMKYIFFLNESDQKQLELCSIFHHSTQSCFVLFPKDWINRSKKKKIQIRKRDCLHWQAKQFKNFNFLAKEQILSCLKSRCVELCWNNNTSGC